MYPDLSYFFHDILGTSVDNWTAIFKTFGMFLVFAFTGSYMVLRTEMIRKEGEGLLKPILIKADSRKNSAITEALLNGLFSFFFAFKIPYIYQNFDTFKRDPAGHLFTSDGNILLGLVVGLAVAGYYYYTMRKSETPSEDYYVHPYEKVGDIVMIAAVSGIVGSKLFSIFENFDDFLQDPIGQFFSGSGLTIYGGLILAFAVVYYYVKKWGFKPIHMMDMAAPAIFIGYAVGRMGCQFSGDGDWGIVNAAAKPGWFVLPDWVWSFNYPRNVLNQGELIEDCVGHYCHQLTPPVFPTPIYEIIITLLSFALIWSLRKKIKTPGVIFFMFLILTGIERFFIEFIRVNPKYDILGFNYSMSQYIAVGFVVIGAIALYRIYTNRDDNTVQPAPIV